MRLCEKFEKAGYFWLPSTPDEKLPGTIRIIDSGKTELEILGIFGGQMKAFDLESDIKRINGIIEGGKFVTLDKCFYKNKSFSSGEISKSLVHVNFVFIDVHYDDEEDINFSSFKIAVEGLDEWLSISGIKVENDFEAKRASINFNPPDEIQIKLTDDIDLIFTFAWTYPSLGNVTEAKISQKAYIKLISKKLLPLQSFISISFKLTNFLCFAIDQTVSITSVTAYSYDLKSKIGEDKEYEVPIKIYYPSLPFSQNPPKIEWHTMLFRYQNISETLPKVLSKWLDAYDRIEPAFNLYFASKTGAHKYIDGKFLSLSQGIETFHRRTSNESVMPDKEFEKITTGLLDACPKDRKKWLEGKLVYSNELNLRTRLKQIVKNFETFYGSIKNRKSFINQIVNTRNYLTHYDINLKSSACSGAQLVDLCMKMECLFQLHFMKKIGFSNEQIGAVVDNNYKFNQKLESNLAASADAQKAARRDLIVKDF